MNSASVLCILLARSTDKCLPEEHSCQATLGGDCGKVLPVDGDKGVLVEDCMYVSRAIEHNLDREEQDFSLEISSAGATTPLVHQRQYKKNIGRTLKLKTVNNEKYEAVLTAVDTEEIVLQWKAREPKPIGKGKVTVQKTVTIPYQNIEKAQIKLVF